MAIRSEISVIIPTFNRSLELVRALNSLACQTDKEFEVVVCDDGSHEDIRAIIEEFTGRLDIQYVRIENSGGPARPRNVGIAMTKGKWLAFLDSDDWWDATRIEYLRPFMIGGRDLVYHQMTCAPVSGFPLGNEQLRKLGRESKGGMLHDMIIRGNPIATSGVLVKRTTFQRIGGFDEDPSLHAVEDFDAWLRLAEGGCTFCYVPQSLGYYSTGGDNISAFGVAAMERYIALFNKHLQLIGRENHPLAYTHFNYVLGSYAIALGNDSLAKKHFGKVQFGVSQRKWLYSQIKLARLRLRHK